MTAVSPASDARPGALPAGRRAAILLVDDREEGLLSLEVALRELGQDLVKARSGQEALSLLFDQDFAVVLLDVHMPGMDGFETAELIRKRERSRYTPIIFVTAADATPRDIARGYAVGAVDYLFKPFAPEVLKAKTAIFLDLFRKSQELQASEQRFRTLVTNIPGAVYRLVPGTSGQALFVTDPIERISGFPVRDFLERRRTLVEIAHPEDRPRILAAADEAVRQRKPYALDYRILHRGGETRWVHDKGQAVYDGRGNARLLDGALFDITDRKLAEQELKRRTHELETANKELDAFSYSVSHDLRAPLRAIDGFSQILLSEHGGSLNDDARRLLAIVRENTNKMAQLINDLLEFSRMGRASVCRSEVDLTDLVRSVLNDLAPTYAGHPAELSVDPLPSARCDPALVRLIFLNLLSNAVKYTRPRETRRIAVGGRVEGDENVYFVRDNGVGFSMDYAHKLFGVFQRLHSPKEFEGTGVGLALVQRVVHRHGGRVWADAKPGEGATFYFTLPRQEAGA